MTQATIYIPLPENKAARKIYADLMEMLTKQGFEIGQSLILTDELGDPMHFRAMGLPIDSVKP